MNDETPMIRHRINTAFGNGYLLIGEQDIMVTIPDENQQKQAELRAMTEAICRIASKAMKARLDLSAIAEQLRKADSGRCTILSDLAAKMEEFTGEKAETDYA